jgi:hypothetical protein
MKAVIKHYLGAILVVGLSIAVTAGVSCLMNPALNIDSELLKWLRVTAASIFAASALGRLGWSVQTWSGDSKEERLNSAIFKVFYVIGFDILILTFLLNPTK